MSNMQFVSIIISLGVLLLAFLTQLVSGIAYIIRLESRLSSMAESREANKRFYDAELSHLKDKLATAVQGLTQGVESTQAQVEGYRHHTENKIDELGRQMSAKFEKVIDKLDQKQDKA